MITMTMVIMIIVNDKIMMNMVMIMTIITNDDILTTDQDNLTEEDIQRLKLARAESANKPTLSRGSAARWSKFDFRHKYF